MKFFGFNSDRAFGIEIEISDLKNTSTYSIRALGWNITSDPSILGNGNKAEIVSPILRGRAGLESLKQVCDILADGKAKVNISCGIHVHNDVLDYQWRDLKKLMGLMYRYEDVIYAMLPPSRSKGYVPADYGYTSGWGPNNWRNRSRPIRFSGEQIDRVSSHDHFWNLWNQTSNKYYGLNFYSYASKGTIEFRYHSGSTEYEKLYRWIVLTQAIVEAAKNLRTIKCAVSDDDNNRFAFKLQWFADAIGIKPSRKGKTASPEYLDTFNYLVDRIEKFNPELVKRVKRAAA